jgi:hypothetical protein
MAEHGTYARYQQDRRRGIEPCADCKRATAEYQRQARARDVSWKKTQAVAAKRRAIAVQRLIRHHPTEFEHILASIDPGQVVVEQRPKSNTETLADDRVSELFCRSERKMFPREEFVFVEEFGCMVHTAVQPMHDVLGNLLTEAEIDVVEHDA